MTKEIKVPENFSIDIKVVYDAAGNITTDPNLYEYEYDYENRLIRIYLSDTDLAVFTYDALGRRIQKYHVAEEITTTYYAQTDR